MLHLFNIRILNIKKIIAVKAFFLIIFFCCFTAYAQKNEQDKSSTDLASIQSRTFKNNSYKDVFRSVVTVLQDNKFKITFSDQNSGIISATGTPEATENMTKAGAVVLDLITGFGSIFRTEEVKLWTLSTNIEDLEKNRGVRVRLVITSDAKKDGTFVTASESTKAEDLTTSNPEIYQSLFSKIEKELFMRNAIR